MIGHVNGGLAQGVDRGVVQTVGLVITYVGSKRVVFSFAVFANNNSARHNILTAFIVWDGIRSLRTVARIAGKVHALSESGS